MLRQFVCSCDEHYLAKNLSDVSSTEIDYDQISKDIGEEASRESLMYQSRQLTDKYGDFWQGDLPTRANPDYEYLCRIIKAVQEGLAPTGGDDA